MFFSIFYQTVRSRSRDSQIWASSLHPSMNSDRVIFPSRFLSSFWKYSITRGKVLVTSFACQHLYFELMETRPEIDAWDASWAWWGSVSPCNSEHRLGRTLRWNGDIMSINIVLINLWKCLIAIREDSRSRVFLTCDIRLFLRVLLHFQVP